MKKYIFLYQNFDNSEDKRYLSVVGNLETDEHGNIVFTDNEKTIKIIISEIKNNE
ncbi:MAG: hypothetical protein LBT50_01130 [Prevotellaceae bacterium]|jgi:hypothetical protein|nr:hypothetical protein [Prevotellaceae bacterium]